MVTYESNNLYQILQPIIEDNRYQAFEELVDTSQPIDMADALELFPTESIIPLLEKLPAEKLTELYPHFEEEEKVKIIPHLNIETLQTLLNRLLSDEQVTLYLTLSKEQRDILMPTLSKEEREAIITLSSYPEESIGSIASADYVSVTADGTVSDIWHKVRQDAKTKEALSQIYITDEYRHLIGVVSLQDILLSKDSDLIRDIMDTDVIQAKASENSQVAIALIERYDLPALPVTDNNGHLIGIVTIEDAMEKLRETAAGAFAKLGGNVAMTGPELDYQYSSFWRMFRVRGFWLVILTIFGVFTSTFVARQEEILSEVIILAAFLAPIVDMGGNTGSQSATLVIRSMALGDIHLKWKDIWFIIKKEIPVALALGVMVALVEVVLAFFFKSGISINVLMVVGFSMITVTFMGGLFGIMLPFIAKRFNVDPATLSSPMLTSIMDFLGVVIYFGFAYWFLSDLLVEAAAVVG